MKKGKNKIYIVIFIIIVSVIIIDQISKVYIIKKDNILKKDNIENSSILSNNEDTTKGVGIITNLAILFIILKIIVSDNQFIGNKTKILISFAFAGGLSNLIDKMIRGQAIEFIHIGRLPAFNIADISILIGWITFVAIFTSFSSKEFEKKANIKKKE